MPSSLPSWLSSLFVLETLPAPLQCWGSGVSDPLDSEVLVSCLTGGESRGDFYPRDLLVALNPEADTDSNTCTQKCLMSPLPGRLCQSCARQAVLMRPPDPSRLENATNGSVFFSTRPASRSWLHQTCLDLEILGSLAQVWCHDLWCSRTCSPWFAGLVLFDFCAPTWVCLTCGTWGCPTFNCL